jgi:peroxiredoxin
MAAEPRNLLQLPGDLPVPVDDGACDHLPGMRLPAVSLPATDGSVVDLSAIPGRSVVYAYPRTGRPDQPLPTGWDAIPGARGCTPQSCAYHELAAELAALGARVFGLSTQDTAYQREAAERLRLPFPLLGDESLAFASALGLPTCEADGTTLIRRLTLVVNDGVIETVFYPVFPPDEDAANVAAWLQEQASAYSSAERINPKNAPGSRMRTSATSFSERRSLSRVTSTSTRARTACASK